MSTRIWQLLNTHHTLQDILSTLIEEYEVQKSTCQREILQFLQELERKNLIVVHVSGTQDE